MIQEASKHNPVEFPAPNDTQELSNPTLIEAIRPWLQEQIHIYHGWRSRGPPQTWNYTLIALQCHRKSEFRNQICFSSTTQHQFGTDFGSANNHTKFCWTRKQSIQEIRQHCGWIVDDSTQLILHFWSRLCQLRWRWALTCKP